jgi:hypothetical protein
MKTVLSAAIILFSLAHSSAFAAERVLDCALNGSQGHGKATLMEITGHPELILIDLRLETKLVNKIGQPPSPAPGTALLAGLLVGAFDGKRLAISGLAQNDDDGKEHLIINPDAWNLQGEVLVDGSIEARFYDNQRVLQRGFGASLNCR